jgi:uncharacterized damage-inducible protein DinB
VEDLPDQVLETWHTNNRINLMLIDAISEEGMKCTLSKRGGRNVVRQWAHLHNVRVWHLETRARDLSAGLHTFETQDEPERGFLTACLLESADRVAEYLRRGVTGTGKARHFRKGVIATLGYFINHESHHRGSTLLTLKVCGHPVKRDILNRVYDWDKI